MARPKKERPLPPGGRRTTSGRITITMRDPRTGQRLSHSKLKPDESKTYATPDEAWAGYERVQKYLSVDVERVTLGEFWTIWTDPEHWQWGKISGRSEQSLIRLASATRSFVTPRFDTPIELIDEAEIKRFMGAGGKASNLNALATLFSDAERDGKITTHPCRMLARESDRHERKRRKADRERDGVPTQEEVDAMLLRAERGPYPRSFYGWLKVAVETGMRGGEIDAMEWDKFDLEAGTYRIDWQWNDTLKAWTPPKHNSNRTIPIDPETMAVIETFRGEHKRFVFANTWGSHWQHAVRDRWWALAQGPAQSLRQLCGGRTMKDSTRHFWASRAINVWKMTPFDCSILYGHKDGGATLIETYVRKDADAAIEAARQARTVAQPSDLTARRAARGDR